MKIAENLFDIISQAELFVLRAKRRIKIRKEMTWSELSQELWTPEEQLHKLNSRLRSYKKIRPGTVIIYPGEALNVSYTTDGLKWTTHHTGFNLYYGRFTSDYISSKIDTRNVYTEVFVPRNHYRPFKSARFDRGLQTSEFNACDKALRLLY